MIDDEDFAPRAADVIDRASKLEDDQRNDALAAQARRAGLEGKTVKDSATHCAVCGGRIPLARRRAYPGTQTCAPCKTDLERAVS